MIPYGKQEITQQDIDGVVEVLNSEFLTQGPKVPEFERLLLEHAGAKYAFAMNSATSALHVACLSLGLCEDDWLWTSPTTFVATANAGLYCGAQVDFVDINPKTYNMCPIKLEEKLAKAKVRGRLPKVVIPVHLCGQSCDMEHIRRLADKYGFKIIEDAAHAIGGCYQGQPVGSCEYSDITVFSFHPVKIITTAEGGAALTNNEELAKKISLYRSHGITRDEDMMTEKPHGPWFYQQLVLGFNYRMTELQAALGVTQMRRLNSFVCERHRLAERYDYLLEDLPVIVPSYLPETYSALHLYVIRLKLSDIVATHREVFENLRDAGIGVNVHYIPVHLQPYYRAMGFELGDFPESEKYYSEAISLPMYPNLSEEDQDKVVEVISSALSKK